MCKLYLGDCIEIMQDLIKQGIKVDAVIADPPYGKTACKWDSVIPFESMWDCLHKITKDNGAIVLFGSEPFSSALRLSNIKNYKYDWIWKKSIPTGCMNAKRQPMKNHEVISVFYKKQPKYNPIMEERSKNSHSIGNGGKYTSKSEHFELEVILKEKSEKRYPTTVKFFNNVSRHKSLHPTQKPIALIEYLIKTYTNEGETVLDFTMGSGSTGVACKDTKRNFIGIELKENYFRIAKERIEV